MRLSALGILLITLSAPGAGQIDARPPATPTREVHYSTSTEVFPNPERGFYHELLPMWKGSSRTPFRQRDLERYRQQGVTLVRAYYVIDEFRDAPISAKALAAISEDLDTARRAGIKVVPRFTYNFPGGGIPKSFNGVEDASVDRILEHIDELTPVLRDESDVIAFLEAGFVGAWGEWHHSSHELLEPDGSLNAKSRAIVERLITALPASRQIALRYPFLKQQLVGPEPLTPSQAFDGSSKSRIGAMNDCFLRDTVDAGTYSQPGQYESSAAVVEATKAYLAADNRFVVQTGETCADDRAARPFVECPTALADLSRMHWSAINLDYFPQAVATWRREGCFDDIQRHLGYRFRLVSALAPEAGAPGERLRLSIAVANDGWASLYNPRPVELVLRNVATHETHPVLIPDDPRRWAPGETHDLDADVRLPASLEPGTYELLLNLPAPEPRLAGRPEYSVRLANLNTWEAATGFNRLGMRLRIVSPPH